MAPFKLVVFLSVLMACVWSSTASVSNENTIESTLERLLERNDRLEARVLVLENENKLLKESIADALRQREEQVGVTEGEMTMNRHKYSGRIKHSLIPLKPRRQLTAATVAFTAVVSLPSLQLGLGQTVVYDSVITNVGGAYNSNTGVFTAPVDGVYVFNFADMLDSGRYYAYLELVKDGNHVMWNYDHAVGASNLTSSSRTATVEMMKGSEVWVRTPNRGTYGIRYIHGNTFSTFSGWVVVMTK